MYLLVKMFVFFYKLARIQIKIALIILPVKFCLQIF
jgi:hypothetical protein